jgi:hypothetical protein
MAKFFGFVMVVALFGLCVAEEAVDLTDADFDSSLESMDTALVMFYAPW